MSAQCPPGRSASPWVHLPPDLLKKIADSLDLTTTIRLSAVCTEWASILRLHIPRLPPFSRSQPIPWLLHFPVGPEAGDDSESTTLAFYDLKTAATYSIPVPVPSLSDHQCWGSKKGWLVTVDPQFQFHLIKPLTGAHVLLPYDSTVRHYPRRVILCRTPDCANGYLVVSMYQNMRWCYSIAGAGSWTSMECWAGMSEYGGAHCMHQDVIFYNGKLSFISMTRLSRWEVEGFALRRCRIIFYSKPKWWTKYLVKWAQWRMATKASFKYLLEWRGELLVLATQKVPSVLSKPGTKSELYRIDIRDEERRLEFIRVKSLGEDAVFVGSNYSYAASTSGVDDVRGNCIYFAENPIKNSTLSPVDTKRCDFEVYDLGKKTYTQCSLPESHVQTLAWFRP